MIWAHQPNVHIHQECCLLPLRFRRHTGTVFSILDVNRVTKLTTKSLTHHEFFMKFTIMWLEKMFYWLLIQILLLNLDLKWQKCTFKWDPQTDVHQYTVCYGLKDICVKNIYSSALVVAVYKCFSLWVYGSICGCRSAYLWWCLLGRRGAEGFAQGTGRLSFKSLIISF